MATLSLQDRTTVRLGVAAGQRFVSPEEIRDITGISSAPEEQQDRLTETLSQFGALFDDNVFNPRWNWVTDDSATSRKFGGLSWQWIMNNTVAGDGAVVLGTDRTTRAFNKATEADNLIDTILTTNAGEGLVTDAEKAFLGISRGTFKKSVVTAFQELRDQKITARRAELKILAAERKIMEDARRVWNNEQYGGDVTIYDLLNAAAAAPDVTNAVFGANKIDINAALRGFSQTVLDDDPYEPEVPVVAADPPVDPKHSLLPPPPADDFPRIPSEIPAEGGVVNMTSDNANLLDSMLTFNNGAPDMMAPPSRPEFATDQDIFAGDETLEGGFDTTTALIVGGALVAAAVVVIFMMRSSARPANNFPNVVAPANL